MDNPRKFPLAGGAMLALSIVVGTVAGTLYLQPSIGFLAGLTVGVLLLVLVFLFDRRS